MTPPKIKLRCVHVKPEFVLDHGTHLEDIDHPPVTIPADEWPTYSGERFAAEVKAWQKQLDAEHNPPRTRPKR